MKGGEAYFDKASGGGGGHSLMRRGRSKVLSRVWAMKVHTFIKGGGDFIRHFKDKKNHIQDISCLGHLHFIKFLLF